MNTEFSQQMTQMGTDAEGSNLKAGLERRAMQGIEIRAAAEGTGSIGTLVGHAAVFGKDSAALGRRSFKFVERIAPGAFTRSLNENKDVRALWDHNPATPIGRTPDTLRIKEDDEGLAVEIDLPDTSAARDLLSLVRAKIIDAMSFGFQVVAEKWEEVKDGADIRTLIDVDLVEVSAVTFPAYPDTSIAERSLREYRGQQTEPEAPATQGQESPSDALVNDELLEPEWRQWELLFGVR
jgi:HK97 family phage prohead protease